MENNAADIVLGGGAAMAILNITYNKQQGDLPDPLPYDLSDDEIKRIATEALAVGIKGIDPVTADFTQFMVDRTPAHDGLPDRLSLRPKTAFGFRTIQRQGRTLRSKR